MTIRMQTTIDMPSNCKDQNGNCSDAELKNMLEDILKKKKELKKDQVKWVDDSTVELSNVSNQTLQWFLLQAEEQGKDISFTKQTVIKIE